MNKCPEVCVRGLVKLIDEKRLREFVRENRSVAVSNQPSFSTLAYSALVSPENAPSDVGFELISCGIDLELFNTFYITLSARVFDREALYLEARARYAAVTGNEDWEPEGLAEAVYISLVGCNADPVEPETSGLELMFYVEEIDVPYVDAEIEDEDSALAEAA